MSCVQTFNPKCYYFYISALISVSLIGVCTAMIFSPSIDSNIKSTSIGILTSVLTFWANPPRHPDSTTPPADTGTLNSIPSSPPPSAAPSRPTTLPLSPESNSGHLSIQIDPHLNNGHLTEI
jgi:hypothetical protein